MYEAYFQLQRRPFSATPDPKCFFASSEIQEILDELVLRIESGQGIGVLTSAAGTGKTLLCRRIVAELSGRFTPIFLANANFPTRRALLQAILFEMQCRYSGMEEQELRLELQGALRELASSGRSALLIIDEAHLLNERLLEEVRTLATLTHGEEPLVRLILCGQLSLEEKLADPALAALNQRVACHVYLEPLTRVQSREYVDFRTKWAGGETTRIFSDEALDAIAHACNGLPRCLNQLCDHCLLLAYVAELPQVSREIVNDALADLKQLPLHWNESLPALSPLAALSAVVKPNDSETAEPATMEMDQDDDQLEPPDSERSMSLMVEPSPATVIEIGSGSGADTVSMPDHSIEVGCSESTHDRESWEFRQIADQEKRMTSRNVTAPAAQQHPSEETVHDRYAALDSRSRRPAGTFSDQGAIAVAGIAGPAAEHAGRKHAQARHDAARDALPLECEADSLRDPRPDKIIDEMLPLIAEACSTEICNESIRIAERALAIDDEYQTIPAAGHDIHDIGISPRNIENVHLQDAAHDVDDEIEERIGSDVLDVCLDVQQSLGNWGDEITTSDTAVYSDTDMTAGALLNSLSEDFDVVEPEISEVPERPGTNRIPDIAGLDRGAGLRQIPQPRYKRVFSTLRRKMARQKGQL